MGAVSRGRGRPVLRRAALVAAGGALGTTLRAVLESAAPAQPGRWPATTFAINLVGSFVLGALLELLVASGPDEGWRRQVRLGAGTGVVGGFTTYSTFIIEVERLLTGGAAATGIGYALISVLAGVACAVLGIAAARWVAGVSGRAAR